MPVNRSVRPGTSTNWATAFDRRPIFPIVPGGGVFSIAGMCRVSLSALWLISVPDDATPDVQAPSTESARIAFASHRDGNWEVYVTDADGRNQTRLTRRNGHTRFPLWSPDRSQIAFATQVDDSVHGWELWVMNADGTDARRLCSGLVAKSGRAWSPDGKRIALTRSEGDNMDVYVVNVASGRLSRVTSSAGDDRDPAWSPDGSRMVFTSERDGNREVYVARADGSDVQRLTAHPSRDASPSWSPDGSRILFVSARTGTSELHLMSADGLDVEQLTSGAHSSTDLPRWSPDGAYVAFQIAEGSRYDIGLLRMRDRHQTVLVGTPDSDGSYTWSPDGTRLAYITGRSGAENLYVVNIESSRSTRITADWSLTPSWTR